MVEAMKQYFFVKPMATDMFITVSQRGEPIEVMTPGMDGYTVLAEWTIDIAVGDTPLLYKRIMMPPTTSEHDLMVMVDTIISIEFTEGMHAVKRFEMQEGDY
jgi:hypothetical protein